MTVESISELKSCEKEGVLAYFPFRMEWIRVDYDDVETLIRERDYERLKSNPGPNSNMILIDDAEIDS